MHVATLISHCREQGIEFCLGNGTIRVRGYADTIEKMLPLLRERKAEIMEYLSMEIMAACGSENEFHLPRPFCVQEVENALMETRSLLHRLMSKRA